MVPRGYHNVVAPYFMPMDLWLAELSVAPIGLPWVQAFVSAANDISANTEINFHMDGRNPVGRTIWLAKANYADENTPHTFCEWAHTRAPVSDYDYGPFPIGKIPSPGATLVLNSGWSPTHSGCANSFCGGTPPAPGGEALAQLPLSQKIKIATHELLHALGMMHPAGPNSAHLPNTAIATGANAKNYASVMWEGCVGGNVTSALSSDDIASVNLIALVP